MTTLNPDPLRPPDTDIDFMPSADYVQGFDDGYSDAEALRPEFLTQVTAFGLGIVIGMALAAALVVSAAASRPGPDPTAPSPASDVAGIALASRPAASASGQGQSGTPRPVVCHPRRLGQGAVSPTARVEREPPAGRGIPMTDTLVIAVALLLASGLAEGVDDWSRGVITGLRAAGGVVLVAAGLQFLAGGSVT